MIRSAQAVVSPLSEELDRMRAEHAVLVNSVLKQQRRQRQRKRHLKININFGKW